jgi:hypothetical protein
LRTREVHPRRKTTSGLLVEQRKARQSQREDVLNHGSAGKRQLGLGHSLGQRDKTASDGKYNNGSPCLRRRYGFPSREEAHRLANVPMILKIFVFQRNLQADSFPNQCSTRRTLVGALVESAKKGPDRKWSGPFQVAENEIVRSRERLVEDVNRHVCPMFQSATGRRDGDDVLSNSGTWTDLDGHR